MLIRTLSLITTLTCLSVGLSAQELSVNPDQLTAGGKAEVSYSDPDMAGKDITVEIDNGSVLDPRSDYVKITLDEEGNGKAEWDVPDSEHWMGANFTGPDGASVSRLIVPPPEPIGESAPSQQAADRRA